MEESGKGGYAIGKALGDAAVRCAGLIVEFLVAVVSVFFLIWVSF